MERLTEINPTFENEEFWTSAREPDDEEIDNVYFRLKAYEDLGKTPEELQALVEAEQDERLVKLPCKHGDEVFWNESHWNGTENEWITRSGIAKDFGIYDDRITLCLSVSKKKVVILSTRDHFYLSREEAEAALKECE